MQQRWVRKLQHHVIMTQARRGGPRCSKENSVVEAGKEHGQGSREGNRLDLVGKWEEELKQLWGGRDKWHHDDDKDRRTHFGVWWWGGKAHQVVEDSLIVRLKHFEGGESAKTKQSLLKTELSFGPHLSQSWWFKFVNLSKYYNMWQSERSFLTDWVTFHWVTWEIYQWSQWVSDFWMKDN